MTPHRAIVGLNDQRFGATWPLIEMVATPDRLDFHARFGLAGFWVRGALSGRRLEQSSKPACSCPLVSLSRADTASTGGSAPSSGANAPHARGDGLSRRLAPPASDASKNSYEVDRRIIRNRYVRLLYGMSEVVYTAQLTLGRGSLGEP